eukprot:TRINITY_DN23359_c0_g1_i1.p1 TRINITY_DN23359_c0_g1~~TRINITY_DN23359_c0_g1_i1.p1  ORF type:complete len:266 (-),score=46.60 TRINITY_DN23359_c0_g1_i1:77-874(-)
MLIPIYQVDAFSTRPFGGNPAAVCVLEQWLPDSLMQNIAMENNLSETAFCVRLADGRYHIRWFTPTVEVDLCGHATLATAHILLEVLQSGKDRVVFDSRSGELSVTREADGMLTLNFPAQPAVPIATPAPLVEALKPYAVVEVHKSQDLLVLLENEEAVQKVQPSLPRLLELEGRGVIVTSRAQAADKFDFVSRMFAPKAGIDEDPVCGSAHCTLTPYWSKVLGKATLHAHQISRRGGELLCTLDGDRVRISGRSTLYLQGFITV